jgi:hypothetical protein
MSANKDEADNRSNQLNPNNGAYWSSRASQNADDDDDRRHATSDYVSGATLDYCRRLQESQMKAVARGEEPPTSVPVFE